jgi:hypothetical protein
MQQAGNAMIAVESFCTSEQRLYRGALTRWDDEGGAPGPGMLECSPNAAHESGTHR